MRFALLFVAFALVVSCGSVVPATLARLRAVDPLTADPTAIAAALVMPAGLRVAPGSAIMTFEVTRSGENVQESFTLMESLQGTKEIDHAPGSIVTVFAVRKADLPRLLALQSQIKAWKAADPKGTTGSFAVNLGACGVGDGPSRDARGSIFLRTQSDGPFLPLVREAPLRALIGPDLFDAIKPCAKVQ